MGRADMAILSEDTPRSTPRARAPPDMDMAVDRVDMDTEDTVVELVVDIPTSTAPMSGTVDLEDMATMDLVDMATVDLVDTDMVDRVMAIK